MIVAKNTRRGSALPVPCQTPKSVKCPLGRILNCQSKSLNEDHNTASMIHSLPPDLVICIAFWLLEQPLRPNSFAAARLSAMDLISFVLVSKFTRNVIYTHGRALRLEAVSLSSPCVMHPFVEEECTSTTCGTTGGRFFNQMLKQSMSLVQLNIFKRTQDLMVAHCSLPHCSNRFLKMSNSLLQSSSPLYVNSTTDYLKDASFALQKLVVGDKTVKLQVVDSNSKQFHIIGGQHARGDAPGGVLLASFERAIDGSNTPVPSTLRYASSRTASVFSPTSSLQRGAIIKPKREICSVTIRGSIVAVTHFDDESRNGYLGTHTIALWSAVDGTLISTSDSHSGVNEAIWMRIDSRQGRSDVVEVYTLVRDLEDRGEVHGRYRSVEVCVHRYTMSTKEWDGVERTHIHLGSLMQRGSTWNYAQVYDDNFILSWSSGLVMEDYHIATESPVASIAIVVHGWIERDFLPYNHVSSMHRILVVNCNKSNTCPTNIDNLAVHPIEDFSLTAECSLNSGILHSYKNTPDRVMRRIPNIHLSPCGTVLITIPKCKQVFVKSRIKLYRLHKVHGWIIHSSHDSVNQWNGYRGPGADISGDLSMFGDLFNTGIDRSKYLNGCGIFVRQPISSYSSCGKYLAVLYNSYTLVIDVYEALCNERLVVTWIRAWSQSAPVSISWVDGLFFGTHHGVLHIGSSSTPA